MSFVTLHTGLSGLRAAQAGVDTTAHNVANAATPGYTRQRLTQFARPPYQSPVGPIGTGVEVEEIVRLRDMFLDTRVRESVADFTANDARQRTLARLETVYGEPDNGITTELNDLWAAFDELALDPSNAANRRVAMTQLEVVVGRVQSVASGQASLVGDTELARDEVLIEAQELVDEIARINKAVRGLPSDQVSNTLLDQRDLHADRLAELLGTTSTPQLDGTYTVTVGGQTLVAAEIAATLSMVGDAFQVDGTTVADSALGGEIAGLQELLLTDFPDIAAALEDVVATLVDGLNAQHAAGFTEAGAAGGALLGYTVGDAAATLVVTIADIGDFALQGAVGAGPHDATNALALAGLRLSDRGDNQSHDDALRAAVVDLGSRVASAQRRALASAEIATTAETNRMSMHGVSIDEEMVALVQYQRALEASSRVMTAADEMLDTIVNRLGIVGR